jgi:hypothetical protein
VAEDEARLSYWTSVIPTTTSKLIQINHVFPLFNENKLQLIKEKNKKKITK